MRSIIHNHEKNIVSNNLNSYKTQIKYLKEIKNTTCPLYYQLVGKAELCEELLNG